MSSADGVLLTSVFHKFSGLNRHRDWYPFEPGHLQGLAYVWPPLCNVAGLDSESRNEFFFVCSTLAQIR